MNDERLLVEQVLAGDKAAFERLVSRYQRLVSHIVARIAGTEGDFEDICQDVFFKVYKNLKSFHFDCKLSSWIGRIAHNTSLNHVARKRPASFSDFTEEEYSADSYADGQPGPVEIAEQADVANRLKVEIRKLPQAYRTALTLYHLEEMSYIEIGQIMGLPINTVKSHIFRARRMLKEKLLSVYRREDLCA
jgi:RNA polymerase sigma-70 factor (ECF subfamily)